MKFKKYLLCVMGVMFIMPAVGNDDLIRQGRIAIRSKDEKAIKNWKIEFENFIKERLDEEDYKADLCVDTDIEKFSLLYAVREGYGKPLIEVLFEGAPFNQSWSFRGFTLLHAACDAKKDNAKFAEMFIEEGADIYAKDNVGKRPIDYAAQKGVVELLQLMAQKDPHLVATPIEVLNDKKEFIKKYALDYAVAKGRLPAVQFLLKHAMYEPAVIERNKQQAFEKMYNSSDRTKKTSYQYILDELKKISFN